MRKFFKQLFQKPVVDLVKYKMQYPPPKVKPRIRYKLKPSYCWDGKRFIGVWQCLMITVTSLFFLSSAPAEANHASSNSVIISVPGAGNRLGLSQRSLPYVPIHIKAPSAFIVGAPPIKYPQAFWPKLPREKDWLMCQMQLKQFQRENEYNALVDGPRATPYDWRKFWAWLTAIGTIALASVSAISYGRWRSMK